MPASGMVVFKQLTGFERELRLDANAAPHGRARKEAVAEPEIRLRESEVYYGDSEPTVHIFGDRNEPITFKGRFRDRKMGAGYAKAKNEEVKRFVKEKQMVRCTWDDLIDIHGLITSYKPGLESASEITYEMEVKVMRDLLNGEPTKLPVIKGAKDITNQIIEALKLKDKLPFEPPTLKGSFVDVLNGMVGDINSASATLLQAVDDIDAFVTGTFTALRRFRAGLQQLSLVVTNLRNVYENLEAAVVLESESADQSQPFWDLQAAWNASTLEAFRLIAEAEREAAKAEQGKILAIHTAALGETWESISKHWFNGSAERAADIRAANGAEVGTEPVPGTEYFVPR